MRSAVARMNSSSVELTVPSSPEIESAEVVLIDPRSEGPIRAERLGLERLEGYAARLAAACVLATPRRAGSPLLRRFVENTRVLIQVHRQLVALGDRRSLPGIDAEWLVDNFHIIDDSLREVHRDLPPGYDELLPKLVTPPLAGYPRVFALALALVAHCDSELDEARITRFVRAFQEVAPLTIGELWALPTMLRLVLLENLRRLAERMVWGWEERQRAERWAVRFPSPLVGEGDPPQLRRFDRPVRGPADAAPARPGRCAGRVRAPRGRAGRAGLRPQRSPPPRAPLPGRQPGHGRQLRAQPPPALGHRLECLLRAVQPGRGDPPRGPLGVLPATGVRHQRPIPADGRDDRPGVGRRRDRSGASRPRHGPTGIGLG